MDSFPKGFVFNIGTDEKKYYLKNNIDFNGGYIKFSANFNTGEFKVGSDALCRNRIKFTLNSKPFNLNRNMCNIYQKIRPLQNYSDTCVLIDRIRTDSPNSTPITEKILLTNNSEAYLNGKNLPVTNNYNLIDYTDGNHEVLGYYANDINEITATALIFKDGVWKDASSLTTTITPRDSDGDLRGKYKIFNYVPFIMDCVSGDVGGDGCIGHGYFWQLEEPFTTFKYQNGIFTVILSTPEPGAGGGGRITMENTNFTARLVKDCKVNKIGEERNYISDCYIFYDDDSDSDEHERQLRCYHQEKYFNTNIYNVVFDEIN